MYANSKTLKADSKDTANQATLDKGLATWKNWRKADLAGSYKEIMTNPAIESFNTKNSTKAEEEE